VVIVGAGVAGLEAMLALRSLAGHRVEVTLVASESEFLYRPVTVGEAFGRSEARAYPLRQLVGDRVHKLLDTAVTRVEPDEHLLFMADGTRLPYDVLVIATGAVPRAWLPGALTFRGRPDVAALRHLLDELVAKPTHSVAFAVPSESVWPLPIYELALMTAAHLREHGCENEVWLITPEQEPLAMFGPEAARAVAPLLRSLGIQVRTSLRPASIEKRALVMVGGVKVFVDQVVTLPELEGPWLSGLPSDNRGFIPVDSYGRVLGVDDVYAAGDATAFPLKQGGLAAQQADTVAETIAAELGMPVDPQPFSPVLRGLLITDGAPLYLRAEPQRLPGEATVAIEARPVRRTAGSASAAAGQPLWWPPAKIAGRHLGPFLATARPSDLAFEPLADRHAVGSSAPEDQDQADALELALLLADCDAKWGDYFAALNALDAALALEGALPPEYEAKRKAWTVAAHA